MNELVAPDLPNEWANIDDSSVSFEDENTIDIIFEYKTTTKYSGCHWI